MKQFFFLFLFFSTVINTLFAQYDFTIESDCRCTPIKNQQRTGTCWSFSTVSFLESELIRMGKPEYDISEMYAVRTIYADKARNYFLRQGKANFSQGSLAHDVIRAYKMGGVLPESAYSGKIEGEKTHDHGEMEAALKGMLDGIIKRKKPSPKWQQGFESLMDSYMGAVPDHFEYEGKKYTPVSFSEELGINPDDYVSFTSYTHHPFYEECILEIPDNYSNGSYYNVPFEDLEKIVRYAIDHSFSINWDGDVSEVGFSSKEGIAIVPVAPKRKNLFEQPGEEEKITQELRQSTFMDYSTTDDHLMHITGIAKDQRETPYFIIKNSWGEVGEYKGYLYMSLPYFQLKIVGILLHKDGVPPELRKKLDL